MKTRIAAILLVLAFLTSLGTAALAAGGRSPIAKGGATFGVTGGGGADYFAIGGQYGYFIADGLRPGISLLYINQSPDPLEVNQLDTTLSLRYYLIDLDTLFPFVEGDGGMTYLSYSAPGFDESYTFYRVGGGGGVLMMVAPRFGVEVAVGVDNYVGVDTVLLDAGVIPEGPSFRWSFGFSFFL